MMGLEILGAVDAALGLISSVDRVYTNFRDAPAEIRAFCDELESLRHILNSISTSILSVEIQTLLYEGDKALGPNSILVAIRGCESEFNTAWRAVSHLRSAPHTDWKTAFPKVGKSMLWILNNGEIEKSTRRLQSHKQNLVLSMLHSGIQVDTSMLQNVSNVKGLVEGLGADMKGLRDELFCGMRLLECQIMNQVSFLSGAARTQHDANERLMLETSGRFTNLVNFSSSDSRNSPGTDGESPQISPMGSEDVAFPSEQEPLDPHEKKPALKGEPNLLQEILGTFRPTTRWQKFNNHAPEIQDVGDLNEIISTMAKKALRKKSYQILLVLSKRVLPNMKVFENVNSIIGGQSMSNPLGPLVSHTISIAVGYMVSLQLLLESISEIQDALICCEREYALYREPELKVLMSTLYFEALDFFQAFARSLIGPIFIVMFRWEPMRYKSKKIIKLSKRITREAEYFHRREVREINKRVLEVDRKQDLVMRALEEQQRALEALREEEKVLATISDHQQVLQALQQLLARFPPLKGESSQVGAVVELPTSQ